MENKASVTDLKQLILPLIVFSFVTNLAILVSPIFMMQVLDRVVPSGNISTLLMLLFVAVAVICTQSVVEMCRDTTFDRTGRWVEQLGSFHVLQAPLKDREDLIQNVAQLGVFFRSAQASNALNLPWIPLFLFALFLIHPAFTALVIGIVGAMILTRAAADYLCADKNKMAQNLRSGEFQILKDTNDQTVVAGMQAVAVNLGQMYFDLQSKRHVAEQAVAAKSIWANASVGLLRTSAQLLALSLGAYLVVDGSLTAGGMIGASIIAAKSIGTIEGCFNHLPEIKKSYAAYKHLLRNDVLNEVASTEVASLQGNLKADGLIFPRGGGAPPRLDRISFDLAAGECLAIVGDSGSGKTTLLQALAGLEPSPIGSVFFDETEVKTIGPKTAQMKVGYLPQQARIVKGTIAQNIACFQTSPDDEKIIKAAKLAGVHGLISALPNAYDTEMGAQSYLLSAGQKQRVALARAIFERPKYLFLDEPNALLDAMGERQLFKTLEDLKKTGTTIIMVLHRSGIMGLADKLLVLDQGRVSDFGARSEVLGRMNDGKQRITLPLQVTSLLDLNDWIVAQFARHSDKSFCQNAVMVATEIFNVALINGPQDQKRDATFVFKFINEHMCEIILREERATLAADKMPKIRSLVKHPEVNMLDLDEDEMGLAVIQQVADKFDVLNVENSSIFSASLSGQNAGRLQ